MAINKTNAMTFATNVLTWRLNSRPYSPRESYWSSGCFLSRSTSTQKRHRWGVHFYMEIMVGIRTRGAVMSLPLTPGGVYEHFGRKTGDNLGMDPVGH